MQVLGLTPAEFHYIVRCCDRVLLSPYTDVLDLRCFLVNRLSDELPDTAARIEQFDDDQLAQLREEILNARRGSPASILWP